MELLGKLGRTREAIAQYDALREILKSTAAAHPSQETEQVRRSLGSAVPAPPPARKEPAHLPAQTKLVGRAAECARLAEASGVVLLVGEPGIGKTRLLEELASRAEGRILLGRCYEAEQARPYGCIIEALRASGLAARAEEVQRRDLGALLTELSPPPEGLDRARLFDAVAALLRENAPLSLLLDDLQWMDEASAALAHYLARTATGVRLVLAAREGELADNAAALRLLRALRRDQSLVEIQLKPLDAPSIAELLRAGGLAADPLEVHAQSAGNPLLALELGRALAEGHDALSGGLLQALEQRIEALEEGAQSLLGWAAALGGPVQPALLARATGRSEAEIVETVALLERRGVLRFRHGGVIDFAHDLMREAVLRRIPTGRRRLLHAALARALQDTPGLAGTVARQALLGGEDALAVRASVAAAQEAMRVFAAQEALALAQQALPLLPALPRKERLRAHLELLQVCLHADRREERLQRVARELSGLVLEAEASGLADVVADGLHALSLAHYFREDEQSALKGSLRSAEIARTEPDPLLRARALGQAGRCLAQVEHDIDQAAKLLDEAGAAAQSARTTVLDVEIGCGLVASFNGDDAAARRHLLAAADGAHQARDHWRETEAYFALCRLALERGEAAEALRAAEAVLPVAVGMPEGDEPALARGLLALSQLLEAQQRGRADPQADALFRSAADELRKNEARWRLAQLLLQRGDLELAAGRLDEALALVIEVRGLGGQLTQQMRHGRAHVLEAEVALARGDAGSARTHLSLALTAGGSISARLRARISAAAARAGFEPGGPHAEVRGGV